MSDLMAALAAHGISLKRYTPGASGKVPCPRGQRCGARDRRDPCLSVTIDEDGMGAKWHCHRASCGGWQGGVRVGSEPMYQRKRKPKAYRRPPEPTALSRPDQLFEWFAARGIERKVVEEAGVYLGRAYFQKLGGERPAICFPYRRRGELVAMKYRALEAKQFTQEKDVEKIFYGLDNLDGHDWCVIVEGELDALAHRAAGIMPVLSVPDGAPATIHDGPIDRDTDVKFDYIWNCRDELERMKKIIIAVDDDEPGRALEEELSRRLGRERCWRVRWPLLAGDNQVKDGNQCLIDSGPELLRQCIEEAEPWPIKNLYRVADYREEVVAFYRGKRAKGLSTGFPSLDRLIRLPGSGMLTVVTGIPGHGKSEFLDQIGVNMAEAHGWRTAFCSFETTPERHLAKLAEKRLRMPFYEGVPQRMGEGDLNRALDWLDGHFHFIRADGTEPATIDWILETARAAVVRHGIKLLIIDPYNRLEHQRPERMTETEYVAGMLSKVQRFAMSHGVDVFFVAHPFKLPKENGKEPVPQLSDISGSVHWYNIADFGMVIWRDRTARADTTTVKMAKVKWKDLGGEGITELAYDRSTGVYSELTGPDSPRVRKR
jgi:twinkle protein